MIEIMRKNSLGFLFFFLFIVGLALAGGRYWHYKKLLSTIFSNAQHNALLKTNQAVEAIDAFLTELIPLTQSIANTLSNTAMTDEQIITLLQEQKSAELFGLGVAFLPQEHLQNKKFAPYIHEQAGKQQVSYIEQTYDYTTPESTWFHEPMRYGEQFNKPYFGQVADTVLIEYAVPFYNPKTKNIAGIAFASQSVEHLQHLLSSTYRDTTGYSFIISQDGTVLSHPMHHLVRSQTNIVDLAQQTKNKKLKQAVKKALQGKSLEGVFYYNEINNTPSWLFCKKMPQTGLILCYSFDINELIFDQEIDNKHLPDLQRKWCMQLMIILAFSLIALICFIAFWYEMTPLTLWLVSAAISLLLTITLCALWYITYQFPDYTRTTQLVRNKHQLNQLLSSASTYEKTRYQSQQVYTVPTGIFINQLQFNGPDALTVVAYIWQRYHHELHKTLSQGFILPQARRPRIQEIGRMNNNTVETVLWLVEATVNQQLSYSTYPFDAKDLRLEIWHKDFDKNVILTPDFDSYRLLNIHALAGIDPSIDLGGWKINGSYFGYQAADYATNFGMYKIGPYGMYSYIDPSTHFEYFFNVMTQRNLIDTVIADLIPLIVIAAVLFMVLITSIPQGYGVLGSCAGILFAIIVEHSRFRSKAASQQLVYFENLYLVMYVATALVAIVSLLYLQRIMFRFIQYRSNLISQLLYWPLVLTTTIIITVYYLY